VAVAVAAAAASTTSVCVMRMLLTPTSLLDSAPSWPDGHTCILRKVPSVAAPHFETWCCMQEPVHACSV
jgi:hypothetical protein